MPALLARAGQGRELPLPRRRDLLEPLACALQRSVRGRFGDAERLGDLRRTESEDVAQYQDRAVTRRQALQSGDERESDRLPRFVPSLGLKCVIGNAFEQNVWVGLEPD